MGEGKRGGNLWIFFLFFRGHRWAMANRCFCWMGYLDFLRKNGIGVYTPRLWLFFFSNFIFIT